MKGDSKKILNGYVEKMAPIVVAPAPLDLA